MAVTNARADISIGRLATLAACNLETVRYYERISLLKKPLRTPGGHRLYGPDAVSRLIFIRRARELGFSIEDIRSLLGLVDRRNVTCEGVLKIAQKQLGEIRLKIADLRKLERVLTTMTKSCVGGNVPECPVIDALFSPNAA